MAELTAAEAAVAVGLVAVVPALYSAALPNVAELRRRTDDGHDTAALHTGIVAGALVVAVAAAATGSRTVLAAGLVAVVGIGAMYAHAVQVTP